MSFQEKDNNLNGSCDKWGYNEASVSVITAEGCRVLNTNLSFISNLDIFILALSVGIHYVTPYLVFTDGVKFLACA